MDQTSVRNHLRLPHDALILFLPADRSRPEKNYSFLTGLVPQIKTEIQREVLLLSGPRPYEDMVWLYNAADVILLPSVYECSPVVIKEAMACNRPIVASDAGDIKKVIGATAGCHVLNGWDEREYLDAIIEASKHGSTEGRTVIFAHGYDWPTIGKKVSAALMTAIHKKNGQG
jgi:teichuronic acid biosynthesis glycosyltransferase TuaC